MIEPKAKALSVSEMARMVGLSRARFYQLMGSTFPTPVYDIRTRRPFFTEQMQEVCLEVRRRNCGIDGKAVLFYARRFGSSSPKATKKKVTPAKANGQFNDLIEGLRCLGLTTVTVAQVESAVRQVYPDGVGVVDAGTVLRTIFLNIRRQNTDDNVAR
jgi:hypothetical protein